MKRAGFPSLDNWVQQETSRATNRARWVFPVTRLREGQSYRCFCARGRFCRGVGQFLTLHHHAMANGPQVNQGRIDSPTCQSDARLIPAGGDNVIALRRERLHL